MMNTIKNVVILITNSIENKTNGLVWEKSNNNSRWVKGEGVAVQGIFNYEKSEVI